MPQMYAYPATLEAGNSDGTVVVTFADVPEAITQGSGRRDALDEAAEALGLALLTYARLGRPLPVARKADADTPVVAVDADVAAKLAVVDAFRASGWTKSELARQIGRDEKEVRRILDPTHPTKLRPLRAALAALGRRLVVGVETIAA